MPGLVIVRVFLPLKGMQAVGVFGQGCAGLTDLESRGMVGVVLVPGTRCQNN